jgi:hypothetical protein
MHAHQSWAFSCGRLSNGDGRCSSAVRVVAAIWAFAAFFVIIATAALVVGIHDAALFGASFGVTAGGAVLVVVAVVLLVAVYELVRLGQSSSWEGGVRPPCKLIVLVALFLTILLGVYVFFAAVRAASAQRPLVVIVGLLFIIVALLGLRFFATDAHVTLPRLGAAVALGLIGTTIGVGEFWYQNQYAPSHAGRAVALKVELHRDAQQPAYDVIRATVSYEDIGGKSVSVLGSAYTLTGSRVVRCHQPATTTTVQGYLNGFLVDPQRSRYMADVWEERPAAVLAAGKFVGDGKRLDSNVASGRDLIFLVPRHSYQLLRFRAQLFAIPGAVPLSQRMRPQYVNFAGDHELYGFWHIDDDSWFHDLVYGRERWVVLRYELVDPGNTASTTTSPDLRVTARFPDPAWSQRRPSEASVRRLFGEQTPPSDSNEAFAGTEMGLDPVATPDARDRGRLPKCSGGG